MANEINKSVQFGLLRAIIHPPEITDRIIGSWIKAKGNY